MKRKYIKPTTKTSKSQLQYHVMESTPTLPFDYTDGTDEALTKEENKWGNHEEDDASWGESIW